MNIEIEHFNNHRSVNHGSELRLERVIKKAAFRKSDFRKFFWLTLLRAQASGRVTASAFIRPDHCLGTNCTPLPFETGLCFTRYGRIVLQRILMSSCSGSAPAHYDNRTTWILFQLPYSRHKISHSSPKNYVEIATTTCRLGSII